MAKKPTFRKIVLLDCYNYQPEYPPQNAVRLKAWLEIMFSRTPAEHHSGLIVRFYDEPDWYEGTDRKVEVYYLEPVH